MGNVLTIGIGSAPNDTTGDPLRTAMTKTMTAVNGLAGNFNAATAPPSLMPFQSWFDTSTTPPTFRFFDGVSWVPVGTLNQTTHTWASLAAASGSVSGDLTGTLPAPTIAALAVTNAKMAAGAASANIGSLTGDLTGALPGSTIAKIQGTAVSGVTGTGNAVLSAAPTITGAASISSIPFNPSVAVQSTFAEPAHPGILLTAGTAFHISGAPTSAGQDTPAGALYVSKDTNYTGVPSTGSPPAIYGFNNVHAGAQGPQVGVLGTVFNANTTGSQPGGSAGAVGTYGIGVCGVTGGTATWGGVIAAYDTSAQANPPNALIGLEVDCYANGTDSSLNRIGILIVPGTPTGSGTVNTVGHGLLFGGNGGVGGGKFTNLIDGSVAHAANGIVLSGMTFTGSPSGVAFSSPGYQIDVVGNAIVSSLTTSASTTAAASMNIPQGTAPTSPNNGDIWMTSAGLFYRFNSTTHGPL